MLILLKKMMSALCDMKLLDTSLKSNGDLRKTTSSTTYCYDVVDMQAVSEPPVVANNSSVICKTFSSCPNTPNTVVSFRIAASFPCNSRSLLSASLPQQSVAETGATTWAAKFVISWHTHTFALFCFLFSATQIQNLLFKACNQFCLRLIRLCPPCFLFFPVNSNPRRKFDVQICTLEYFRAILNVIIFLLALGRLFFQ